MTTFATIDIANLTVTFHATEEAADAAGDARDHFVACSADSLTILSGPQQVALYNATAAELATNITPVNKFANKEAGAKRLWANLADLRDLYMERQEAALKAAKAAPAPKPKAAPRAPAQPGREIWRRVKREEAQKVAYRPVPGSVQAGLYDLLTDGGMTMEDYCEQARKLETSDGTLFTPPQVWGALRYLFVTKRGYGLDFDGSRIRLLIPADERSTERSVADPVPEIKAWATANYEKNWGASALVETFTDDELRSQFKTLADAKRWAKLQSEAKKNAEG